MTYDSVLEYMELNIKGLGSVPGLDSVKELLKRAGNPEMNAKVIHIAGTNGKGSISTFIAESLKQNGYKVGRFLSPALSDFREMISVNGVEIPKTKVAEGLSFLYEKCNEMKKDGLSHPTEFEIETVLAFWYFQLKKCDFIVLECGMGGELDATNVVDQPLLSVFASISLDHCAFLGNTLTEIARTKAGIMKKGCKAVSCIQEEEVKRALLDRAEEIGAQISFVNNEEIGLKEKKKTLPLKQSFSYKEWKNVSISLLGTYQLENAATALLALEVLEAQGIKLNHDKIMKAFQEAKWPGRFEILGRKPVVIADGAHNPDAVHKLMETMDLYFTNKRIIYIMGVLKDKEYSTMYEEAVPRAEAVITVTSPNKARALPAFELAKAIRELNPNVTAADSVEEALEMAQLMAGKDGIILAFGSLSYLGKLRESYERMNHDR